jgi:hypothetical protein
VNWQQWLRDRPASVYRLFDADDRLLYVGCSESVRTRLNRKVSASLMGQKIMWEQLNIFYANAKTTSDYNQERWQRASLPNTSVDLEELKYWSHRSADLVLELAKSSQAILEDTTNVQTLFPDTPKLRELCQRIYTFKTMKTPEPLHVGSLNDVAKWKEQTDRDVQALAESVP